MSARKRLDRARATLAGGVAVSALLWGAASVLAVLAAAGALDMATALSRTTRHAALPAAVIAGVAASALVLWQGRRAVSAAAVALWLEERLPELRYTLVTLLEPRFAGVAPDLERVVAGVSWARPLRRALLLALTRPLGALAAGALVLFLLPAGVIARVSTPRTGDVLNRPRVDVRAAPNYLVPLVATVIPPRYSRLAADTLEEPSGLVALPGSRISLHGRGPATWIRVTIAERALPVHGSRERWQSTLAMPERASALHLRAGDVERLVVLEPRPDSAPVVSLAAPARDTVFREPRGALPLNANAMDDFGLGEGWFEYIVSSGEGERFTFRPGRVNRIALGGRRRAALRATLSLERLKLQPGDVVHVRAVMLDENDIGGPGRGTSATRTFRVARAGEYDSVAVEGAPPPDVQQSEVSQRMLIMQAQALQRRRPRLAREAVVAESRAIGADQARLRKRVGSVIFARLGEDNVGEHSHYPGDGHDHDSDEALSPDSLLAAAERATGAGVGEALDFEGDESPVVAVNRTLLDAYNAMWDAVRELEIGEPGQALPHMRSALEAIQRARRAERLYLRGRIRVPLVDIEKVRLRGQADDLSAATRTPRAALDSAEARRAERYASAVRTLRVSREAGIDSLMLLRVDALEDDRPALAAALGRAIDALQVGRDAESALARVRRLIAGAPESRRTLPHWGGVW